MSAAAREYASREHELGRVADLYVAALEEAAGGPAVRDDAAAARSPRGAAEVGLDDEERLAARAARGRPWPLASTRGAPARSLVRAVPVWAWLTAIVAVSALARFVLALRVEAPWIMVDELIYSELARGLADGDGWSIRGVATNAYGFVYPLLLAPAYALFDSLPQAYAAVKAINSVVISLAALPAYFLARRVLPRGSRCSRRCSRSRCRRCSTRAR